MPSRPRWSSRPMILAVLLAAGLGLAGCSGAEDGALSSGAAAPAVDRPAADEAGGDAADGDVTTGDLAANGAAVTPQVRLVRTAEITVAVEDLRTAAARVRSAATGLGGTVASEVTGYTEFAQTAPDAEGASRGADAGESVLVLRVPVDRLDGALERVAGTGQETSRSSSTEDVTADLVDLQSREKTATESVTRVRALLAGAEKLSDVVLLEGELTRREADLEALQARRAALADRADLATLTVVLRTSSAPEAESEGFLGGLRAGWAALGDSTVVALQVVGALIPWLGLLAVVLVPVRLLVIRRARRRDAERAAQAAAAAAAAAQRQEPVGAG